MGDTSFSKPSQGGTPRRGGDGTHRPGFTGRYIVAFESDVMDQARSILKDRAGLSTLSARDVQGAPIGNENVVLEEIGVAVLSAAPEQHQALLTAAADSSVPVKIVEEERMVFAIPATSVYGDGHGLPARFSSVPPSFTQAPGVPAPSPASGSISLEFLRGYATAVENLMLSAGGSAPNLIAPRDAAPAAVSDAATWGLLATNVPSSRERTTCPSSRAFSRRRGEAGSVFSRSLSSDMDAPTRSARTALRHRGLSNPGPGSIGRKKRGNRCLFQE